MSQRVLIVDDSLTVRMDLAEAFEDAGFESVTCGTLAEARAHLDRERFALVILDVRLPDGDGIELLREIRASPATDPALMLLSAETEVSDRIRGLSTGADEYVGKPYERGYVVFRARELLRKRRPASSGRALVLVIEDSPTFREELHRALESDGYLVASAATGEEGLRMAADMRPAAIIVDGALPGIDGATVIRRLRLDAALRRIPCLLLTASMDRNAELQALEAGADTFVRKTEDVAVVLARLRALLRPADGAGAEVPESVLGPKKILAVDDSPTYRDQVSEVLRSDGCEVVVARSGEDALELLAVERFDCVLLDLTMPGLGGEESCRRIKSEPRLRNLPVIIVSALEERSAMLRSFACGADDYIVKSSDYEALRARVRAQLRRRQFEEENQRIREQALRVQMERAAAQAARELAETRAALVRELEHKNRELEAFSYSVSHDLRAPLRAIAGFSQLLLDDYVDRLDERGRGYLERICSTAQRMDEIIEDLLKLSRLGRMELRRERMDLSSIAREIANGLRKTVPDRQVKIVIQDGLVADADPRLVRILLENLLGNAWKFTSRTAQPVIELATLDEPDGPVYFVRDNGVGFEMAYANRLFVPFQRLHSEAEFSGTGIGLATVHRIVERHGGRVWAEAAPGKGATFYFTLKAKMRDVAP